MKKSLSLLVLALGAATSSHAHHVWLEQAVDGSTVLRFGEYAQNLREASPGLLDQFTKPIAIALTTQGNQDIATEKMSSGFVLNSSSRQRLSIVAEESRYPLMHTQKDGTEITNWYYPAARQILDFEKQDPKLPLDLVPAGQSGAFTLYLLGKPLAKTKVALITQSGWSQHIYSDDQGHVKFPMPWKGQYVAEVKHIDTMTGKRGNEKYDQITYVTTVTFVKADGMAPLPAGPIKAPKK